MAKNKKLAATAAFTLAAVVAAGEAGMFTPTDFHAPLVAEGLVEINTAIVEPATGNIATRATQKGIESVNTNQTANQAAALQTAASKPTFNIEDGIEVPKAAGRGRTSNTYPFDQLNVGQSFFVPNDEKKPNAAKSLASTVSSATARYAEDTGQTKQNSKGETVPVMKNTRQFVVRAVEGGARIWRTA